MGILFSHALHKRLAKQQHQTELNGGSEMKPVIKKDGDMWICGGATVAPWYIDWYRAATPALAYAAWLKNQ